MRPQPRSYMPGSAARISRNGDSTMSRWISRKASGSNSGMGLTRWMPGVVDEDVGLER